MFIVKILELFWESCEQFRGCQPAVALVVDLAPLICSFVDFFQNGAKFKKTLENIDTAVLGSGSMASGYVCVSLNDKLKPAEPFRPSFGFVEHGYGLSIAATILCSLQILSCLGSIFYR